MINGNFKTVARAAMDGGYAKAICMLKRVNPQA
jgi:hypothetical protein